MGLVQKVKNYANAALIGSVGLGVTSCAALLDDVEKAVETPVGPSSRMQGNNAEYDDGSGDRLMGVGFNIGSQYQFSQGNNAAGIGLGALSTLYGGEGEHKDRMAEAREGRAVIVINNNGQNQQGQISNYTFGKGRFTHSNAFRCAEGNKNLGSNNKFYLDYEKQICFGTETHNLMGGRLNLLLYNEGSEEPRIISPGPLIDGEHKFYSFSVSSQKIKNSGLNGRIIVNFRVNNPQSGDQNYGDVSDSYQVFITDKP